MTPLIGFGLLVVAALLDIVANVFLERSDGFRHVRPGIIALVFISLAFLLMAPAVTVINLSVAYATWGSIGILGTTAAGWVLLGQRLTPRGWVGLVLVVASVILLTTAGGGH